MAATNGLKNKDKIVSINNELISQDKQQAKRNLIRHPGDKVLSLKILRDGKSSLITFTPTKKRLEDIEGVCSGQVKLQSGRRPYMSIPITTSL